MPLHTSILLATTNPGKLKEFRELMPRENDAGTLLCLEDLPSLPAPEESGSTFLQNARIKALYYSRAFPELVVVAEDTGLVVTALKGAPGVRSARFAGLPSSDTRNVHVLLKRMRGVRNRSARFVTQAVVAREGKELFNCRGEVKGRILKEPRGDGGFGYDPVFYYHPYRRSFAQLGSDEKNRISHRGRAMAEVSRFLFFLAVG